MTLWCDLGQMGGILRETAINNKKPFERTVDFHTLRGLHGHSRLVVALRSVCLPCVPEWAVGLSACFCRFPGVEDLCRSAFARI